MSSPVITIDPNTLQTQQTTFDGTAGQAPLTGGTPSTPIGTTLSLFQNASTSQLTSWIQQAQAMIEGNPELAMLLGLGVLIIAANSNKSKG